MEADVIGEHSERNGCRSHRDAGKDQCKGRSTISQSIGYLNDASNAEWGLHTDANPADGQPEQHGRPPGEAPCNDEGEQREHHRAAQQQVA